MPDTVTVVVRLQAFVRQEGRLWVSACPGIAVYSQGQTEGEAKQNLHEAAELWFESCIERDTLHEALIETGWHQVPPGTPTPPGAESIDVFTMRTEDEAVLGQRFPIEVKIPAYQAALFSGENCAAS